MILEQKLSNPETVDENILYEDVYLTSFFH